MGDFDFSFFIEVLVGGLLSGVMYSLVAIGFVLIYKTSGVLNFAQGPMLLFAALTFVSLVERGVPAPLSLVIVVAIMVLLGIAIERSVLRPLVNRRPSRCSWRRSASRTSWRAVRSSCGADRCMGSTSASATRLSTSVASSFRSSTCLRPPSRPRWWLFSSPFSAIRASVSPSGRRPTTLRRRRDRAAPARILATAWIAAGFVALVAGLLWGARLGVQFSLSLVVLKALPVLVLGGFDSILGAIVGGLIVGATEKLAEVYIGPFFGGGIESWFAYVVALAFLLVRPAGLFGRELVEGS